MKIIKKIIPILILSLLAAPHIDAAENEPQSGTQKAKKAAIALTKDVALSYALIAGTTLIHELGHALVAKILWGSPIDIHFGITDDTRNRILLKLPGIAIHGFDPVSALARVHMPSLPLQKVAVYLAGPFAGALASICLWKLIRKCYPDRQQYHILKSTSDVLVAVNLGTFIPTHLMPKIFTSIYTVGNRDIDLAHQAFLTYKNGDHFDASNLHKAEN